MKKLLLALLLAFVPTFVLAQSGSRLVWDQEAPDLATAQGYSYFMRVDSDTTRYQLSGVVCSGTASPFTCYITQAPAGLSVPSGTHAITLTASNDGGLFESPQSAPLTVMVPTAPANVRIGE